MKASVGFGMVLVFLVGALIAVSWGKHQREARAHRANLETAIGTMKKLKLALEAKPDGWVAQSNAETEFYRLASQVLDQSIEQVTNHILLLSSKSRTFAEEPLVLHRLVSDSFPMGFALEMDGSIKTLDESSGSFSRYLAAKNVDSPNRDWLLRSGK